MHDIHDIHDAQYHQACFKCALCKTEIGVGTYHPPPKRPASSNNPEAVAIAQAAMRGEVELFRP